MGSLLRDGFRGWAFVPNSLTVARFVAGLAFPWIPPDWWFGWLLAGGISDLVDGLLSRCLGATSDFGRLMDPVADKTFVLLAVGTLLTAGRLGWVELSLLATRDVTVLVISLAVLSAARVRQGELVPRLSGKLATAGQFVYLLLATTTVASERPAAWLAITGGLSVWAALDYLIVAVRALVEGPKRAV